MAALHSLTEQVNAKYLGHPITIRNRTVTAYSPDGREIGTAYTISGARRLIKGYRRPNKEEK